MFASRRNMNLPPRITSVGSSSIADTQAVVITLFPGRAAEEVEQQVTVPIERALNSTPNVIAPIWSVAWDAADF